MNKYQRMRDNYPKATKELEEALSQNPLQTTIEKKINEGFFWLGFQYGKEYIKDNTK